VLDLGAGSGILSYLACEAGARKVYAVERSAMIELTREIVKDGPFWDRIVPIRGSSFDVDLPERADVAIASMFDSFGVDAGLLAVVADARARLLKPGGTIVPASVELTIAPIDWQAWYAEHVDGWRTVQWGAALRPARDSAVNTVAKATVPAEALLSAPAVLTKCRLADAGPDDAHGSTRAPVTRPGVMHALAGWCTVTFAEGVQRSNSPLDACPLPWQHVLFPLDRPAPVGSGDVIEATIELQLMPDEARQWAWQGAVLRGGKARIAEFRQGSTIGAGDDDSEVRPARPAAAATSRIAADALALFGGHHTIEAIGAMLRSCHPGAFLDAKEAERYASRLSTRWSR
jgi:protein arginine N-methyltransferase 1